MLRTLVLDVCLNPYRFNAVCFPVNSPLTQILREIWTRSAMVKERCRCSQEQRARDAERKRLARRVDATATGPDAVERRELVREQNTVRQRARRNRLAVERDARTRLSPSSQFFLPLHQYRALHAFMDRLLLARAM